jgi:DHA2 family multidrug resistance protein
MNIPVGLLSLFLTYHFVPEEKSGGGDKAGKRIDLLGFGLFAVGLGCLQVVLDRGQIDDWFGSPLITTFCIIAVVALAIGIIHELTTKDPIVALPLMRNRSFLMSNIVMFFVGIVLFATTQLIPELTQSLFGYDATNAGLTLSPGGLFVFAMMPVAGFLVSRVQPKYLIMFGFFITGCALWYWTNLDLRASFRVLVECRIMQAAGLAFLFVPINTIAYSGLPPGRSNDASALINLMRNYGGSVGVSIVQTMIDRRSQFHQTRLVETITNVNPILYQQTHGPMHRSIGNIYADIGAQSEMLAFLDIFKVLSILAFCGILFCFFLKRIEPGEGGEGGH